MAAIRDASARLKSFELKDCDVFTSNEPCPMCLSACYWARIRKVFYASTVADARDYGNFDDDIFYEELHKEPAERVLKVEPDHESRSSMVEVWKEFQLVNTGPNGIHY
jgi:tRNA(Arg) A34 adenosine deaminase TadA